MKPFIFLILSVAFMYGLVNCSGTDVVVQPSPRGREAPDGRVSDRKSSCDEVSTCSGDSCSSSYCSAYTQDTKDNDCLDICDDYFNGKEYTLCKSYPADIIFDLDDALGKELRRPTDSNLDDIEKQTICALLDISIDPWLDEVEKNSFSKSKAEYTLKWIVDESLHDLFSDGDEELKLIEELLFKMGSSGGNTDAKIVKALVDTELDDDEEDRTLFYIHNNDESESSDFFKFIHNDLIEDICDTSKNHPEPMKITAGGGGDCTSTAPCYGRSGESIDEDDGRISAEDAKDEFGQAACIFAIYCEATNYTDDFESDMRSVANTLGTGNDVTEFIETPVNDGGLCDDEDECDGDGQFDVDEDDAEDWSYDACKQLKRYWDDPTSALSGVLSL